MIHSDDNANIVLEWHIYKGHLFYDKNTNNAQKNEICMNI